MRLCSFVAAAALLSASLAAHADTVITFSGLHMMGFQPFTTYTEAGFTVQNTAGQFQLGDNYSGPGVDLTTIRKTSTVTVTANNGGEFTFEDVNLAYVIGMASYTVTGLSNGLEVFSETGQIVGAPTNYHAYGEGNNGAINSLEITLIAPPSAVADIENITLGSVAATPEPSSFALLGTGLLGFAGVVRKRFA